MLVLSNDVENLSFYANANKICVVFHCYDCGFISAKTNGPDFGIEFDVVC